MWPTGLSRRIAKDQLARIDAAMADDTCRFPVLVTTNPSINLNRNSRSRSLSRNAAIV